jgi:DNA-binding XRE family transcriptional regulator
MPRRDLSLDEQKNVRAYLQMLRVRFGNWRTVERALPVSHSSMNDILQGRSEVSVTIAFRIAKMLDVSLHHVLAGTALSPGTCKHCGRPSNG